MPDKLPIEEIPEPAISDVGLSEGQRGVLTGRFKDFVAGVGVAVLANFLAGQLPSSNDTAVNTDKAAVVDESFDAIEAPTYSSDFEESMRQIDISVPEKVDDNSSSGSSDGDQYSSVGGRGAGPGEVGDGPEGVDDNSSSGSLSEGFKGGGPGSELGPLNYDGVDPVNIAFDNDSSLGGTIFKPDTAGFEFEQNDVTNSCILSETDVPSTLIDKRIEAGKEVELAFNEDDLSVAISNIENATTVAEIQSYITESFKNYSNIDITFDYYRYGGTVFEYDQTKEQDFETYRNNAIVTLNSFKALPKTMLTSGIVDRVDISSSEFSYDAKSGEHIEAGGFFDAANEINGQKNTVMLMDGATLEMVIHEFSHAAHSAACEGNSLNDGELKDVYNQAQTLLNDLGLNIFPDEYSKTNYFEMLAVVSTKILTGNFIDKLYPDDRYSPQSFALQKLVIERLQDALPDIDVVSYAQYLDSLNGLLPWIVPESVSQEAHVSRFDDSFASWYGLDNVELIPIVVDTSDKINFKFIYGAFVTNANGSNSLFVNLDHIDQLDPISLKVEGAVEKYFKEFAIRNNIPLEKSLKSIDGARVFYSIN